MVAIFTGFISQVKPSDEYCDKENKLNPAIHQKRSTFANPKGIAFHLDNARQYTTLQT